MSLREKQRDLPRTLRPDTLVKTPWACRFGWHHVLWGEISPAGMFQRGTCMRCNLVKDRMI